MKFREWWDTMGSGIRPAISSDTEAHARFVANAAWNAAQQDTNVADDVDNAMRLIKAEYYDEGFDLLTKVARQLRAGAQA